jgi:hypothetical protein
MTANFIFYDKFSYEGSETAPQPNVVHLSLLSVGYLIRFSYPHVT